MTYMYMYMYILYMYMQNIQVYIIQSACVEHIKEIV